MAKILIIEDDKDMGWLISTILECEGHTVCIAYNGNDALANIKKQQFDMVISDYKLPGMNGLAVLERAQKIRPSMAAMMISAFGNLSIKAKAEKLGVCDFLDKPFNIKTLAETVEKVLKDKGRL